MPLHPSLNPVSQLQDSVQGLIYLTPVRLIGQAAQCLCFRILRRTRYIQLTSRVLLYVGSPVSTTGLSFLGRRGGMRGWNIDYDCTIYVYMYARMEDWRQRAKRAP